MHEASDEETASRPPRHRLGHAAALRAGVGGPRGGGQGEERQHRGAVAHPARRQVHGRRPRDGAGVGSSLRLHRAHVRPGGIRCHRHRRSREREGHLLLANRGPGAPPRARRDGPEVLQARQSLLSGPVDTVLSRGPRLRCRGHRLRRHRPARRLEGERGGADPRAGDAHRVSQHLRLQTLR